MYGLSYILETFPKSWMWELPTIIFFILWFMNNFILLRKEIALVKKIVTYYIF